MSHEPQVKKFDGAGELANKWYCCRYTDIIDTHSGKPLSEYLHPDGKWRRWVHWYDSKDDILIEEEF